MAKKAARESPQSLAEERFLRVWRMKGLKEHRLVTQHRFCPLRMWRLDFAFPDEMLGIEVQGMGRHMVDLCPQCKKAMRCPGCGRGKAITQLGGHQTAKGMREQCEKINTATLMGWRILEFSTSDASPASVERWVRIVSQCLRGPLELPDPEAHFLNPTKAIGTPRKKPKKKPIPLPKI